MSVKILVNVDVCVCVFTTTDRKKNGYLSSLFWWFDGCVCLTWSVVPESKTVVGIFELFKIGKQRGKKGIFKRSNHTFTKVNHNLDEMGDSQSVCVCVDFLLR